MIYRKCVAGYDIYLYYGNIASEEVRTARSEPSKRYVVWSHGAVILETDSFPTAEQTYVDECDKHHASGGKFMIGVNKLTDGALGTI